MKIFAPIKNISQKFCFNHNWKQIRDNSEGLQRYICEKCGKLKQEKIEQELHLLVPDQYNNKNCQQT